MRKKRVRAARDRSAEDHRRWSEFRRHRAQHSPQGLPKLFKGLSTASPSAGHAPRSHGPRAAARFAFRKLTWMPRVEIASSTIPLTPRQVPDLSLPEAPQCPSERSSLNRKRRTHAGSERYAHRLAVDWLPGVALNSPKQERIGIIQETNPCRLKLEALRELSRADSCRTGWQTCASTRLTPCA